jgi:deoxyribose-phosphate aldolase
VDPERIDRVIDQVLREKKKQADEPGTEGNSTDGLWAIHDKNGVKKIISNGASRVSASLGIEAAGGIDADLAKIIDHTLLKPEATKPQIEQLCAEAKKFQFASVCVNPCYVPLCVQLLKESSVKVGTVIGFPLGATSTAAKVFEAEQALRDGAQELDMVINIGMLKSGEYEYVENDIAGVVATAKRYSALTKVILETCLLTDEEKVKACLLAKNAGADFVKTSTGFSKGGATAGDVALMRRVVGTAMGVKAAGGVRSREEALQMVASGADRIGASASVRIVSGENEDGSTPSKGSSY